MKQSQDIKIMVRISDDSKKVADQVADIYGIGTSTLARMLLERFCEAHKEHGHELIWPPQFNHHLNPNTYLDQIRTADTERLALVAEEAPPYTPGQNEEMAGEDKTHLRYTPRKTYSEEEVFEVVRETLARMNDGEKET